MTTPALGTSHIINGHLRLLTGFDLVVHDGISSIELIIKELYFSCAVTLNAPAHSQAVDLDDAVHFLHRSVALIAGNFPDLDMLSVVKVAMVW